MVKNTGMSTFVDVRLHLFSSILNIIYFFTQNFLIANIAPLHVNKINKGEGGLRIFGR